MKELIYISSPSIKSLGNTYSIYPEKIVLSCKLFLNREIEILKEDLLAIDVCSPITKTLALRIDLADLYTHVGIKRRHGRFKHICFAPQNPFEFVEQTKRAFG